MRTQKELKDIFAQHIAAYWKTPRMIDYCIKKAAYIVELDGGELFDIDKPSIEKDFCFGYGYCGVSTQEDYNNAEEARQTAATDQDYFMRKNLEGIDQTLKALDEYKVYKRPHYYGQAPDSKLYDLEYRDYYQAEPENGILLTPEEIERVKAGYQEVRQQFVKRLNTYLKKYGLSKLHTWTYLSD